MPEPALCLPRLASISLVLDMTEDYNQEVFHVGGPLAPEQGAQGVCNALGRLVAAGVLPALRQARLDPLVALPTRHLQALGKWDIATCVLQVLLEPCAHISDTEWEGGPGPECNGAACVEVLCRNLSQSKVCNECHGVNGCALRKPERRGALSEAALRAFDSLHSGYDVLLGDIYTPFA